MFMCICVYLYILIHVQHKWVLLLARYVAKTVKQKKPKHTKNVWIKPWCFPIEIAFASFFDFLGELAGLSPRESS